MKYLILIPMQFVIMNIMIPMQFVKRCSQRASHNLSAKLFW